MLYHLFLIRNDFEEKKNQIEFKCYFVTFSYNGLFTFLYIVRQLVPSISFFFSFFFRSKKKPKNCFSQLDNLTTFSQIFSNLIPFFLPKQI